MKAGHILTIRRLTLLLFPPVVLHFTASIQAVMSDSIVIEKTSTFVRFKATSKDVTPSKSKLTEEALRATIQRNKVFHEAFKAEEKGGNDGTLASLYGNPRRGQENKQNGIIIQSSEAGNPVFQARNGFVSAVLEAYNQHHCLVLRPDDVWHAILTQFSFYVNAHAEELRDCFVDFAGKKTLVISMQGNLFSANYSSFANRMVDEQISKNLKDAEVAEWLLPKFSTTKNDDRVAASVTIMSTLQAYFEYVCSLMCGIPEVTLEGTPEDWQILRKKIDRLPQYDLEGEKPGLMSKWHGLLAPVLDQFKSSADGKPDLEFWDKVCSHHGGGSGPSYISGWLTVFACFTTKGKWQGDVPENQPEMFTVHRKGAQKKVSPEWPYIETGSLPQGVVSVPVLVDDNGIQYDTQMLAGHFAYEMIGNSKVTLRPRTDWCIAYEGCPKAKLRDYKDGEIRVDL